MLTRPQWPHHMRFATTVDVEETATGSTVGPAEVAWQMTAHEVRALGGLGWGGSLVLRSKSKGLSELLDGAQQREDQTHEKRSGCCARRRRAQWARTGAHEG